MGKWDNEPDVEIEGVIEPTSSQKAILFQGDYWPKAEWVPKSQCTIVPKVDSDEPGRVTIFVRRWLAEKNGWEGKE